MEFYEVLEKRRTYRDFSDREVSDELLKRVIGAAFKAPTNDHLRQLEFIVVRGRENIARIITPLAKNMAAFKDLVFEADDSGDKDKRAMFCPNNRRCFWIAGYLFFRFFGKSKVPCWNRQSKVRSTISPPHGAPWKTCCSPQPPKDWERPSIYP